MPAAGFLKHAVAQARHHAELPPQAFATIKREVRAPQLARIGTALTATTSHRHSGGLS
jgi:hypothetical protein